VRSLPSQSLLFFLPTLFYKFNAAMDPQLDFCMWSGRREISKLAQISSTVGGEGATSVGLSCRWLQDCVGIAAASTCIVAGTIAQSANMKSYHLCTSI
jgi:hypothetical protein